MEAPKCRLCGEKHWAECPSFKTTPPLKTPSRGELIASNARLKDKAIAELEAEVRLLKRRLAEANAKLTHTPVNTPPVNTTPANSRANSRVEYMRQYMRERRASHKAAKNTGGMDANPRPKNPVASAKNGPPGGPSWK
jgi:hypothetical protein